MGELSARLLLGQTNVPGWGVFLVVLAVFVLPFVVGSLIGHFLKLRDLSFRIGIVLFAAVLGLTPFVWQSVLGAVERNDYEAEAAQWESRQLPEAQQAVLGQALDELKASKPQLRIER